MKKIILCLFVMLSCNHAYADTISSRDLDSVIKDEKKPLIVEFSETWCGACKLAKPFVSQIQKEPDFDTMVIEGAPKELEARYHVSSYPTFLLIKEGKPYGKIEGYNADYTVKKFHQWIFENKLLKSTDDKMCECGCGHTIKNCDCADMQKEK